MKTLPVSRLFAWTLLCVLSVWFDSCKKSDDPTTTTPTTTIEGSYKISTLKVDPKVLSLYDDLIAASKLLYANTTCLTDITITFKTGGDATTDTPTSCQSIPVPVSTFTGIDASSKWSLSGNKLTVTKGDGTKTDYTVVSNTGGILKLQWQGNLSALVPGNTVYTYTMELKKQ
jgi:hypothetical protein